MTDFTGTDSCSFRISSRVWSLIRIWLVLRVLTSIWAALVSTLRPMTALEQTIALWPPSPPWGQWLHRALLAPWERWDVTWYLRILSEGYQSSTGADAFHPLYPCLAWLPTLLGIDPLFALMLVGNLSSLVFLFLFERMARSDSSSADAQTASLLLLSFPVAFILFAPYNEGLFLLMSGLTLSWARHHKWWCAGIAGALAVLTRQQGVFLLLPFGWELWEANKRDVRRLLRNWRHCLALGLIPAGLGAWVVYRVVLVGGNQLDFNSPYGLAYSILISPRSWQAGDSHVVIWPWKALQLSFARLWDKPDLDLTVNLVLGFTFVGAVILAWPRLRASYRIYVLAMVLVSFSYYIGNAHPYMGLPRHLFMAFPVFLSLEPVARSSWRRTLWVGSGFAGSCFLIFLYVLMGWIP